MEGCGDRRDGVRETERGPGVEGVEVVWILRELMLREDVTGVWVGLWCVCEWICAEVLVNVVAEAEDERRSAGGAKNESVKKGLWLEALALGVWLAERSRGPPSKTRSRRTVRMTENMASSHSSHCSSVSTAMVPSEKSS